MSGDRMITTLAQLEDSIGSLPDPVPIAVVNGADEAALASLAAFTRAGVVRPLLIDSADMAELAAEQLPAGSYRLIKVSDDAAAAREGVRLVRAGEAQVLMKGHISSGVFLKAVVDHDYGIKASKVLSHVAIVTAQRLGRLIAITDGGMVTVPDAEQLAAIIDHGVRVLAALGQANPKVALLSAAETVIPRLPSAALQAEVAATPGRDYIVEGPISLDIALVPGIGEQKGYQGQIRGDAQVLVCPDIVTGNVLSKSLIYFGDGAMAGVVLGAKCPIILVSRSASAAEKSSSIALAIAMRELS